MPVLLAVAAPHAVEVGPGQSGPVGLLVIVVLCLLCAFLFRSMAKRLRRVPRTFPAPDQAPAQTRPVTPRDDRADA